MKQEYNAVNMVSLKNIDQNSDVVEIYERFISNLEETDQITDTMEEIVEMAINDLTGILSEIGLSLNYTQKTSIENSIKSYQNIKENKSATSSRFKSLFDQSLILMVANFESYVNEIFIYVVNEYSEMINWGKDKTIQFEPKSIMYSRPTVGELVLQSYRTKYNFQNIESVKRFFSEMLNIEIKNDAKEFTDIFVAQQIRHLLIHKARKVDYNFISELEKVVTLELPFKVKMNSEVVINESIYSQFRGSFERYAEMILTELSSLLPALNNS